MKNDNTITQVQGTRRVENTKNYYYEKMCLDVTITNLLYEMYGITCSVTPDEVEAEFTVSVVCGGIEFESTVTNYLAFSTALQNGVGYFLGVFDKDGNLLPEDEA